MMNIDMLMSYSPVYFGDYAFLYQSTSTQL